METLDYLLIRHVPSGLSSILPYQVLEAVHELVEVDEGALSLNVRELGQMTTSEGLLGTIGLRNTEHVAKSWNSGLQVQLRALREEGILAKVTKLEEGGTTFNLRKND